MKYLKKMLFIFILMFILFPFTIYAKANPNAKQEDYANVVFFAYFKGDEAGKNTLVSNFNKKSDLSLYNPIVSYKDMYDGDFETSFKTYINKMSYGKLNVHNIFPQMDSNKNIIPLELSMDGKNACTINIDRQIIIEIVQNYSNIIVPDNLDYDKNGFIDNFTVFIAGYSCNNSGTTLVSHKANYGDNTLTWSNKGISSYNVLNSHSVGSSRGSVISHEFLHTVGFADLYTNDNVNYETAVAAEDSKYPVYIYDVMGMTHQATPQMLTYVRNYIKNWNIIEEIKTSTDLTLDSPDDINGNQSYIIKSPFSDYEFFVVEYRKKGASKAHIDGFINKSGLIVYRVNTTVSYLSNLHGKFGVYVYREQGQSNVIQNLYNSVFDKKDKIGSANLDDTDNVLSFSDGSNSGIELTNIRMENGKIKLHVSIPDEKNYDLWRDTNYTGISNIINGGIINYNNGIIAVESDSQNYYTRIYSNNSWSNAVNFQHNLGPMYRIKLIYSNNNLYMFALTQRTNNDTSILTVYQYENNNWKQLDSVNNIYKFSVESIGNEIYISTISLDSLVGSLYKFNGSITKINDYYSSNNWIYSTKVLNYNNKPLVIYNNNSNIYIAKYNGNTYDTSSVSKTNASFDSIVYNNKIYFLMGPAVGDPNSKLKMYYYDTKLNEVPLDFSLNDPTLFLSEGNMYALLFENNQSSTFNGRATVYAFDEEKNTLIKEGGAVLSGDANQDCSSLTTVGNTVYVMVNKDNTNIIKKKETANSLQSISFDSLPNLTYNINDLISTNGLVVKANYKKYSKVLNPSDYIIENYDTSTAGLKAAKVIYQGKDNIFEYRVFDKIVEKPLQGIKLTVDNTIMNVFDTEKLIVTYNPIDTTDPKNVIWSTDINGIVEITNNIVKALKPGIVKITAKVGTFTDTITLSINKLTLSDSNVTLSTDKYSYTGNQVKPEVTVKVNNMNLIQGQDYKIDYGPNIAVGIGTVIVTGINNYQGQITKEFTITDKPIEKTLREYIYIGGMNIINNYIRGIRIGETISVIKARMTNPNITITSSYPIVTTGNKFTLKNETYYAVIKGDINGDGKINSADLLKMRQHLLSTQILNGPYKEAALLVNNTNINSADLLRLRQYLLGQKPIDQ